MTYDFAIIGGGSAGYAAARTASKLGLNTVVIDGAEELGGLCILRGCMPSKTLLASAARAVSIRRAAEFGLRAGELEVKGPEILARKHRLIADFADYRKQQLQDGPFALIRGTAHFVDAHTVKVALRDGGEPQRVTARAFLLATGSEVTPPPIPGITAAGAWTTDDALEAPEVPDSVIVLGGGATAVEFASYYAGLGRKVTIIQRGPQLLTGTDIDVAEALRDGLIANGAEVFTCTRLIDARQAGNRKEVVFEHAAMERTVSAEQILYALGRRPAVEKLALPATGMDLDCGRPVVKPTQQTSQPHIFAAGDVAGPYEIVHIAIQQGELAARNAARVLGKTGEALEQTDYRLKLYGIFSDPEVAFCGANEQELCEKGVDFHTAKYHFADHGKSMCIGEVHGFVKLIAAKESGEILGGSVVGPHASELIHEIVVAMRFRATARQLAEIPHYHPTLSEIWTYPAEELM
jgi:pyruvate/2-oxoglutarate dehydrogenase complex dihydrolipoamide dehydrogenase (E3) component